MTSRLEPQGLPPAREPGTPYRVCLVCLGNICRSPMAEVVLSDSVAGAGLDGAVLVDSAGTGDWHLGEPMHASARAALARRGLYGDNHRSRQIQPGWLAERDLILAMDRSNRDDLLRLGAAPDRLLLFARAGRLDVADIPDPYYGGDSGFDQVLDLVQAAVPVIRQRLAARLA